MTENYGLQTFTGRIFYPTAPRVEDIDIIDIAHSLAFQCRYNGHCQRFYSVAEHAVLISRYVSDENALWGLMHDGTESYVGDMVRPLKLQIPTFREIEDNVEVTIAARFGLTLPIPDEVELADKAIIADERLAVMGPPDVPWDDRKPLGVTIHAWGPAQAEHEFLLRFAELTGDPTSLVRGLCSDNTEHLPHVHRSISLGDFWCSADQDSRLPWAADRKRRVAP